MEDHLPTPFKLFICLCGIQEYNATIFEKGGKKTTKKNGGMCLTWKCTICNVYYCNHPQILMKRCFMYFDRSTRLVILQYIYR